MSLRKGDTLDLEIDKMAYGGQGVGKVDGFVVFVRGAVPGDKLRARIFKKKRAYAHAVITELISPSPDRVQAPCPYSGHCGGCQWQHVRYERQLAYKKEHVKESVHHIAGLKQVVVHDTIPSEDQFHYRNKMEFSFSDRRWLLPEEMYKREAEDGFALGLHVPGTFNKVIDIESCLLQRETGNQILQEVKRLVKESQVPVYGLKSHEGFWRYLTVRHSRAMDEWMVNLVTSKARPEITQALSESLCAKIGSIKTVVNNINARQASIAVGEREIVLKGKGHIEDRIGAFHFRISANSFFQTNTMAAHKLYQKVLDFAELAGGERVLDLYSGTGTIPVFLAQRAEAVTGIEISESAVRDARRNCEANRIDNCRFICGDIREALQGLGHRPDVLIIDPPRAGMHKDVLAQVLELSPEKIIYVSCNPSTLARDLGEMMQDYSVVEIQPVDMFPHTYHIEAVGKLRRRKN